MSELIVLVGLPGSGKSTWLKQYLELNRNKQYYIASTDDIIERIADQQGKKYSDVFSTAIKQANKEMASGVNDAIAKGYNVIWDQTNMSSSKRRSILSKFLNGYTKTAVVFEIPEAELHKRLEQRGKTTGKVIPTHVIANMSKTYEEPSTSEGFNKIIHVNKK